MPTSFPRASIGTRRATCTRLSASSITTRFPSIRTRQGSGDKSYARGHYYSDKAPGLSFLAVPIYAALRLVLPNVKGHKYVLYKHYGYYISQDMVYLRYAITYLLVIMPSAALVWLLWLFLARISDQEGWSLLLAGVYALGTIAFVYSTWFFSHQLAAVLLFSSFLLIFLHLRNKPPGRRGLLFTVLAGLFSGLAIISEYPTFVIAGCIGVYLLVVAKDRLRSAAAFIAGMLPMAVLAVVYNVTRLRETVRDRIQLRKLGLVPQPCKGRDLWTLRSLLVRCAGALAVLTLADNLRHVPRHISHLARPVTGGRRRLFHVAPSRTCGPNSGCAWSWSSCIS